MTVTVSPVPFVVPFYVDIEGNPLAGGSIQTYAAGTTSPLATYSDPLGQTPNNTTILLNNAGQPETNGIYLDDSQSYKFIWFDINGDQVSVRDNITGNTSVGGNNTWTGENVFTQFVTAAGIVSNGTQTVNGTTSGLVVTGGSADTANGAKNYIGLNVAWNGTDWVTGTDGTANGATLLLANYSGQEEFDIIIIPSTGSTSQVIAPGSLPIPAMSVYQGTITGYGTTAGIPLSISPDSGSFTCTLAGFTTTVTGTVYWRKMGNMVNLWSNSVIQGTSNSTSLQMQGLPTAIQPASIVYDGYTGAVSGLVDNNNTGQTGVFYFNDANVINFDITRANTSTGVVSFGNDFTDTGSKGWYGSIWYPLY